MTLTETKKPRRMEPTPYEYVLSMTSTEPVVLFRKRSYTVHISVDIKSSISDPVDSVFYTGAGPNLINEDFVSTTWYQYICPVEDLGLVGATRKSVLMRGVILLQRTNGRLMHTGMVWSCRKASSQRSSRHNLH